MALTDNKRGVRVGMGRRINYPTQLPNLAAWYNVKDTSSIVVDSSNRVSLLADKSGNSEINALMLNAGSNNSASYSALTPFGTSDFTLVAEARPAAFTGSHGLIGSAANGCAFFINSSGYPQTAKDGVVNNTASTTLLTAFQRYTITYVRSGGNLGTYYVNGVAAGTTVDSQNYTVGQSTAGALGAVLVFNGALFKCRAYSSALDATAVLADYNGTVQANNILNIDFGLATKLATSFTATTGGTVTINTSGATGARICGARDLYMGTVASQPTYLPWSGSNYGYSTGIAGSYFSVLDSSVLDITGNIDIRVQAALKDWTPAADSVLVEKWAAGQKSYSLYIGTNGGLRLNISIDGSTDVLSVSNATPVFTDGLTYWVRVTRASSSGDVIFYTSTDGTTWTQLGTTVASTAGSIFSSTSNLGIAASNTGSSPTNGIIYRSQIYNGINGTLAFDFNPATYVSGTTFLDSSSNAATITLNGGSTIVTKTCIYFDGSNDYMKSAPFSLSQPFTHYMVGSQISWTSGGYIIDGAASANSGALVQTTSTPQVNLNAGSSVAGNTEWFVKTISVITALFNGASSVLSVKRGLPTTGNPGSTAANGIILGASGASTAANFGNITASEVIIYSEAQDPNTRNLIVTYLGIVWKILLG